MTTVTHHKRPEGALPGSLSGLRSYLRTADLVTEVVTPEARKMLRHTDCSILVLRDRP
jgi:hypothetical protein